MLAKPLMASISMFQFHKGTIKTKCEIDALNEFDSFNSIKVRLRLSLPL